MTPSDQSRGADVLVELARRCELASDDDARLNVCIFATVHADRFDDAKSAALYARPNWTLNRADWAYMRDLGMPAYTASLDAAMSLVPEGWRLELTEYPKVWTAVIADKPFFDDSRRIVEADAATPALALTAAALLARAHGDTRS